MKRVWLGLIGLSIHGSAIADTGRPVILAPRPTVAADASRHVMVLAHRGCWEGGAPEGSPAAIRACADIGPDIVEVDVQKTKDNVLVLMHDYTVDRMTNGTGKVADMTAAQIRALRLRAGAGGPNAALTEEPVPTLEEALLAAKGKYIVNLHLKAPIESDIVEIVKTVKALGMVGQVTAWVTGYPGDPQLENSSMRGVIGMIPVIGECPPPDPNGCWSRPAKSMMGYAAYQPAAIYFRNPEIAPKLVDETAAVRARVMVHSLEVIDKLPRWARRASWRAMIDMGANIIMTDHPADLLDMLRAKAR